MMLHNLVEQMQEWAKLLETEDASGRIGIIAGLREVAADVARSTVYSREEKLGDPEWEQRLVDCAIERHVTDDIEIDQSPEFSDTEVGVWVGAWVWV
ncbi:MAG TPA: hypothetical protein EYF98_16340, partial [Planctomycetes bacterium]|nr:hypothetical protein [Planctomycetota bacterium]